MQTRLTDSPGRAATVVEGVSDVDGDVAEETLAAAAATAAARSKMQTKAHKHLPKWYENYAEIPLLASSVFHVHCAVGVHRCVLCVSLMPTKCDKDLQRQT